MSFFAVKARYFDLPRLKRVEIVPRAVPPEKFKEKLPRLHPAMYVDSHFVAKQPFNAA